MNLVILKFIFSYRYKAGKTGFTLMVKKRPLEFKKGFHSLFVLNVTSSCGIPINRLK